MSGQLGDRWQNGVALGHVVHRVARLDRCLIDEDREIAGIVGRRLAALRCDPEVVHPPGDRDRRVHRRPGLGAHEVQPLVNAEVQVLRMGQATPSQREHGEKSHRGARKPASVSQYVYLHVAGGAASSRLGAAVSPVVVHATRCVRSRALGAASSSLDASRRDLRTSSTHVWTYTMAVRRTVAQEPPARPRRIAAGAQPRGARPGRPGPDRTAR